MPHEEQNEWPSFEAVLRNVAQDSPTARALETAPLVEELSTNSDEDRVDEQDVDEQVVVTLADAESERSSSILPEPLSPLEIDTSNIRSLLKQRASESFDTGTILDAPTTTEALAPLPPSGFDVEELDVDELEPFDLSSYAPQTPGTEVPDAYALSMEVFDDLGTITELDFGGSRSHADYDIEQVGFDSIAAADVIETHLNELIRLGYEEPSNVVALRPDTPTATNTSGPVDGPELDERTGAVGLTEVHKTEEREETKPDPWEHMRSADENKETGFWATRTKFFSSDERKRKKAARRAESNSAVQQAGDVTFDQACPNCGSDCQVDLDDPIGRRVHVSCPECQHMWHTPYLVNEVEAVDERTG